MGFRPPVLSAWETIELQENSLLPLDNPPPPPGDPAGMSSGRVEFSSLVTLPAVDNPVKNDEDFLRSIGGGLRLGILGGKLGAHLARLNGAVVRAGHQLLAQIALLMASIRLLLGRRRTDRDQRQPRRLARGKQLALAIIASIGHALVAIRRGIGLRSAQIRDRFRRSPLTFLAPANAVRLTTLETVDGDTLVRIEVHVRRGTLKELERHLARLLATESNNAATDGVDAAASHRRHQPTSERHDKRHNPDSSLTPRSITASISDRELLRLAMRSSKGN